MMLAFEFLAWFILILALVILGCSMLFWMLADPLSVVKIDRFFKRLMDKIDTAIVGIKFVFLLLVLVVSSLFSKDHAWDDNRYY